MKCIRCNKEFLQGKDLRNYYCEDCIGAMPINNTSDYVLCGGCLKRDIRIFMIEYHENFCTEWTCLKCARESIINNRFEILDL